ISWKKSGDASAHEFDLFMEDLFLMDTFSNGSRNHLIHNFKKKLFLLDYSKVDDFLQYHFDYATKSYASNEATVFYNSILKEDEAGFKVDKMFCNASIKSYALEWIKKVSGENKINNAKISEVDFRSIYLNPKLHE